MLARVLRRLLSSAGSGLVLNLFALVLFTSLAAVVFATTRAQVKNTVYVERQAQAQAIADAGLEDALHSLAINSSWRTGFTNKAFADGYYTVTLTTGSTPTIASTGYSASMLLIGRAVRTVSVVTTSTNTTGCFYALQADRGLTISGKVDAYDPTVSLTPSATNFTTGANIWNNGDVTISGAACPPTRVRGTVYVGSSGSLSGSAACAESGVVSTTATLTLPNYVGGATSGALTINASTVTLGPGTYNYTKITIKNGGVLNVNTTTGTVTITFNNNVDVQSGTQINNLSKIPSRLYFADVSAHGAGHTVGLQASTPLHAYIEGNDAQFTIAQEVYGHFCGSRVDVSSSAGAVGLVHYDQGAGTVTSIVAGTWTESEQRQ